MIKIYRAAFSLQADAIEAEFKELVVAYDRMVVNEQNADNPLPYLTDNQRMVSGDDEIKAYLEELALLVREWQLFQANCCHTDGE